MRCRAPTPLFGNGAGAHGIRKISGVLTKIGKLDIVLMYDVSIARLIRIIKLTCVGEKEASVIIFYEIKMENQKKKFFFVKLGIFCLELRKKHTFWHWEWGRKSGDQEP